MAAKDENSGCIIIIIGFVIGTIIFSLIFTDKIWDRALNAPVRNGSMTTTIGLWIVFCLICSWLVGNIWKSFKN